MWIRIRAVIVEDEPLAAVNFGAADGALVHSLMQHNPHLRGIVLYRSEVAAAAAAKARGLAERTEAIGGDFFKSVPEGDLYKQQIALTISSQIGPLHDYVAKSIGLVGVIGSPGSFPACAGRQTPLQGCPKAKQRHRNV
jgi:O-methyltransferase domain